MESLKDFTIRGYLKVYWWDSIKSDQIHDGWISGENPIFNNETIDFSKTLREKDRASARRFSTAMKMIEMIQSLEKIESVIVVEVYGDWNGYPIAFFKKFKKESFELYYPNYVDDEEDW